jgi:DNA-binding GntR family transcriptional regulator
MSASTRISRRRQGTAPETIAAALRAEILAGETKPGTLLRQEDLAARFAMSRIPVRDALRLLEAEGLVTIATNRGAQVAQLSRSEVAEIYHLRILLECDCLSLAIARMSDMDLDRIERIRQRAEIDAATPEWNDGDWAFHEALYHPSGNVRQIDMIRSLRTTSDLYAAAHRALPKQRKRWLADHRAIAAACRTKRSADAVAALTAHLTAARDFVLEQMPNEAPRAGVR